MADTQTYYDSTLTGPELDAALQKLPQVDAAVEQCARHVQLAQSWAEGNTGLRQEEETNNARYWCEQAQVIANGCLGWFADQAALQKAHPAGQSGQWSILGATDTLWIWDQEKAEWVDSGAQVDLSPYYTAEQTEAITPFLHKATFLLDGWAGVGPYTQTAAVTPVDGGPPVTADTVLYSGFGVDDTLEPQAYGVQMALASKLGRTKDKTFGAGTLTLSVPEKPTADAEIYFMEKKGGA